MDQGPHGNHRGGVLTVLGASCCQGPGSRQQLSWATACGCAVRKAGQKPHPQDR